MDIILVIGNVIVLLVILLEAARIVRRRSGSLLLSAFVALAVAIFAMVSLLSSAALAERAVSATDRGISLAVLVVIAILARDAWASEPVE